MKQLIVNADDFGYSPGVNKGIIGAHVGGIVTSTSVMVDSVAAHEASKLLQYPDLSIGLHFVFPVTEDNLVVELERQIDLFIETVGQMPSHVDIHKNTAHPIVHTLFREYLQERGIPYRFDGQHVYINSFIVTNQDSSQSINQLLNILNGVEDGLSELMCHVGYADDYLIRHSSYNMPREQELMAICSSEVADCIKENSIELINWKRLSIT